MDSNTIERFYVAARTIRSGACYHRDKATGYERDVWNALRKMAVSAEGFFYRLSCHPFQEIFFLHRDSGAIELVQDVLGKRLEFLPSGAVINPEDLEKASLGLMEAVLEYYRFCRTSFVKPLKKSAYYQSKYYDINDVLKGGWK